MIVVLAASAVAVSVASLVRLAVLPGGSIGPAVAPYVVGSRSLLGLSPAAAPSRTLRIRLARFAVGLGRALDAVGDDELERRLGQAGWFANETGHPSVVEYRMREIATIAAGFGAAVLLAVAVSATTPVTFVLVGMGALWGATFWRGRLGAAIEHRRDRLRIELYTVNQLLAMRIRVGGGVMTAVRNTVSRISGAVADDLSDAVRMHRSGTPAAEAFRRLAAVTPEPHARRTYLLLATAEERGSDLATSLLALSHDVRSDRREALRRAATKRRAAMLLPVIALLAPILIMFIAAPLPWIVFGELR